MDGIRWKKKIKAPRGKYKKRKKEGETFETLDSDFFSDTL